MGIKLNEYLEKALDGVELEEAQITKKVPQARIRKVMQKAQDAFWKVVAKEFKEVEYGDMDPMQVGKMEQDMMDVINVWLENNYEG